jgi:hypothetical protein
MWSAKGAASPARREGNVGDGPLLFHSPDRERRSRSSCRAGDGQMTARSTKACPSSGHSGGPDSSHHPSATISIRPSVLPQARTCAPHPTRRSAFVLVVSCGVSSEQTRHHRPPSAHSTPPCPPVHRSSPSDPSDPAPLQTRCFTRTYVCRDGASQCQYLGLTDDVYARSGPQHKDRNDALRLQQVRLSAPRWASPPLGQPKQRSSRPLTACFLCTALDLTARPPSRSNSSQTKW